MRIEPLYSVSRVCFYKGSLNDKWPLYFRLKEDNSFVYAGLCGIESDVPRPYNIIIDVHGTNKEDVEKVLRIVENMLGVRSQPLSSSLKLYDEILESDVKCKTKCRLN